MNAKKLKELRRIAKKAILGSDDAAVILTEYDAKAVKRALEVSSRKIRREKSIIPSKSA